MNEFGRRAIVALIAAPLAIGIIWIGGAPLATLLGAMSGIAAWEFYRLAREGGAAPLSAIGIVLSACIPIAVHGQILGVLTIPLYVWVSCVVAILGAAIWLRGVDGKPLAAVSTTVYGVLYTGATLSFGYALRYHNYAVGDTAGALAVLFPVVLTWASDSGAYFSGNLIRGRKLMPSVSPRKTVAGAVGGVLVTVAATYAFTYGLLVPKAQLAFTPTGIVIFGVAISVIAQIGDLAESLLKREAGVKDSGTLFPGHGGVLDRLDSLFFVLPAAYALYDLLLIPAPGAR
ncbi:phosphatidate cytidylyltransferase [Gemmatimonas sp.]|uniref:phosphatidate cytidylyltransferase n=1 Tax=Gemmatimonas sp. TaxID=1962908 RepID=UPI0027B8C22E|nr:phosphatidate cytidylyltransferase [Gemmatimonas sp.]